MKDFFLLVFFIAFLFWSFFFPQFDKQSHAIHDYLTIQILKQFVTKPTPSPTPSPLLELLAPTP